MPGIAIKNRLAFWLIIIAFVVRVFIPGNLLDLLYDYDLLSGGNVFTKIHPGT